MSIEGKCACGAVTFRVEGQPVHQAYCHCHSCQRAHAAPVMATALFPTAAVTLEGETREISVTGQPHAARRFHCATCGTRVMNAPGGETDLGLRGIFPSLCEDRAWFEPAMHIFCEDRLLVIDDDLPKYLDLPEEFGGSGKQL